MSCSVAEHKRRSYDRIKEEVLKDTESMEWRGPNTVVFGFGTKNVPHEKSALNHAKRKQKLVEEWAEKQFPGFGKDWATISTGGSEVVMDIRMPYRLSKALQRNIERLEAAEHESIMNEKTRPQQSLEELIEEMELAQREYSNEWVYKGEVYPTKEDMTAAMREDGVLDEDYMLGDPSGLNLPYYIGAKRAMIAKLDNRLKSVDAQRNTYKNDRAMSELLTRQHAELTQTKQAIAEQIATLENDGLDTYTRVEKSVQADFEFIDYLLKTDGTEDTETLLANIDLAGDMMQFFNKVSDYSGDTRNRLLFEDNSNATPDVVKLLKHVSNEAGDRRQKLRDSKMALMKNIIENDNSIQKLYPSGSGGTMDAADILEEMISDKDDIEWFSANLLSVNKSLNVDDGLFTQMLIRHLRDKINDKKSKVIGFKQRLDNIHDAVAKEIGGNYDMFFRRGSIGRTGHIVDVFSGKWFEKLKDLGGLYKAYNDAMATRDPEKIEKAVKERQNWLFSHTNMIDISRLPEIIDDPQFAHWGNRFDSAGSTAYADELKQKLGTHTYNKLVNKQRQLLQDYMQAMDRKLDSFLDEYKVDTFDELPDSAKRKFLIFEKIHDPFALVDSLRGTPDQYGKVNFDIGDNASFQPRSHALYNAYYPKESIQVMDRMGNLSSKDSGYYDKNYAKIASNPVLKEFWEVLHDANEFMLQTLSQSGSFLSEGSIIFHQKQMTEILLSKDARFAKDGKKFIFNGARNAMRDIMGVTINDNDRPTEDVNRGNITTVEEKVRGIMEHRILALENIIGKDINRNTTIVLKKASPAIQQFFTRLMKVDSIDEVIAKTGNNINAKNVLKDIITEEVMQEQTMNLPLLMKAYLDIVAEYGGRKDALPLAQLLKEMHMGIKKKTKTEPKNEMEEATDDINERRQGPGAGVRSNSNARVNDAYNKLVLNRSQKKTWGTVGKMYSPEEKSTIKEIDLQKKEIDKRIKALDFEISREAEPEVIAMKNKQIARLEQKQKRLDQIKEHMGFTLAFSALYESLVSKLARFRALGYSVSAPVKNQIEGTRNAMIFDSGNYATPGNILIANSFFYKAAFGQKLSPGLSEAKKITNLFIQNMDLIQNGANEFEKNSRKTGPQAKASWLKAYKGTEIAETNIQTPEILALLMDERIEYYDENGDLRKVPVFDGEKFPAHQLVDGKLVLREKFTKNKDGSLNHDVINKWENFMGNDYNLLKTKIDNTIAEINGAYDEFASMMFKNEVLTGSLATFKTWVPNYIWARFAKDQKVLELGKESYTGYYRKNFGSAKTQFAASVGAGMNMGLQNMNRGAIGWAIAAGVVTTGALVGTVGLSAIPIGLIGMSAYKVRQAKKEGIDAVNLAAQTAGLLKGFIMKLYGMPVNIINAAVSNKRNSEGVKELLVKDYDFDIMNLSEDEKIAMNSLTTELAVNTYTAVAKLGVAYAASLFLMDDEEEEPLRKFSLTEFETVANPQYLKQEENDPVVEFAFNYTSNLLNEMLDSGVMVTDPLAIIETMGMRNALFTRLDDFTRLGASIRNLQRGRDETLSGHNQGESKSLNAALKMAGVPKLLTDKYLGAESSMVRDFTPNQGPEAWFDTDYKMDKEIIDWRRKVRRNELRQEMSEKHRLDKASKLQREVLMGEINKLINDQLDREIPIPLRDHYEDDQTRKRNAPKPK